MLFDVVHYRLPGWTAFGLHRLSEVVITAPADILTHHEASLVKIVRVVNLEFTLGFDMGYKSDSALAYFRTCSLIHAIELHCELWLALNKRAGPVHANMA